MLNRILAALGVRPPARACVLLYHRVAEPPSDVWRIAVSPANFEQQARVLHRAGNVIPLGELVEALARKKIVANSVALTFDDGYADNVLTAKPILDYSQLPATFFVAAGNLDQCAEFWWDELENLLLFARELPRIFTGTLVELPDLTVDLGDEMYLSDALGQRQQRWNACTEAPPTRRAALFLRLWQHLKPLPHPAQQQLLQRLRHWARAAPGTRPEYRTMSVAQLRSLAAGGLHTIGGHTVSHPALACHPAAYQQQQQQASRQLLEDATAGQVQHVAYPYGNYNHETLAVTAAAGFRAGFTTEARTITSGSDNFRLGRFQVPNLPGPAFARQWQQWQKTP